MRAWSPITAGLLAALACTACLGQPIPRRVVAGTTFLLPFSATPATGTALPIAYGVDVATNPGTLLTAADPQRGTVRFALCASATSCTSPRQLPLKYLGRVTPDRGSVLGRSGEIKTRTGTTTSTQRTEALIGQTVALLDVPSSTPAGMYHLTYFVRPAGAMTDLSLPLQQIEVVVAPSDPQNPPLTPASTDLTRALNLVIGGVMPDITPSLQGFVPDPQLVLKLVDPNTLADRPAAAQLILRHPASVTIRGVFEDGVLGQGSVVRMKPGAPNSNTVSILLVDLDRRTTGLRVAFTLNAGVTTPVTSSGFVLNPQPGFPAQQLFSTTGALLNNTTDPNAVGNSFRIEPSIL